MLFSARQSSGFFSLKVGRAVLVQPAGAHKAGAAGREHASANAPVPPAGAGMCIQIYPDSRFHPRRPRHPTGADRGGASAGSTAANGRRDEACSSPTRRPRSALDSGARCGARPLPDRGLAAGTTAAAAPACGGLPAAAAAAAPGRGFGAALARTARGAAGSADRAQFTYGPQYGGRRRAARPSSRVYRRRAGAAALPRPRCAKHPVPQGATRQGVPGHGLAAPGAEQSDFPPYWARGRWHLGGAGSTAREPPPRASTGLRRPSPAAPPTPPPPPPLHAQGALLERTRRLVLAVRSRVAI